MIIDTTVDPDAFNYAACAAVSAGKTMCWARVFAGGYGGMIVRSRPGQDPTPPDARALIEHWCTKRPDPPEAGPIYGALRADGGPPMVADDADVSAIAAAFTRLIIDTALRPDDPDHTHSAYMIGLRQEWIFSGPFDTWPIDLGKPLPEPDLQIDRAQLALGELMLDQFGKEAAGD